MFRLSLTDNFLQARTMFDGIAPDDGATWNTLGSSEELADLLKRSPAVLQGKTHQAGDHVVDADQF